MQQNEMYYSLLEGDISKADFDDWLEAYVCERTTAAVEQFKSTLVVYSVEEAIDLGYSGVSIHYREEDAQLKAIELRQNPFLSDSQFVVEEYKVE